MSDLISRQAAIDLFPNDALEWDTNGGYIAPHLARRMIEELPLMQHEQLTVEAIPIEFIEKEVEKMRNSENPAIRLNSVILTVLIRDWRENDKSD